MERRSLFSTACKLMFLIREQQLCYSAAVAEAHA